MLTFYLSHVWEQDRKGSSVFPTLLPAGQEDSSLFPTLMPVFFFLLLGLGVRRGYILNYSSI